MEVDVIRGLVEKDISSALPDQYIFLSPDARASVPIRFLTPFSRHYQSRLLIILTTKEGLQ
jgi:hypothetical protein